MSAANPTRVYRATDSIGTVYTTPSTRPLAFCIAFTGGVGHTAWSNNDANSEKAAARKRRVSKLPGTILTGCAVEILDAIEVAREPRVPALTPAQRQDRHRVRKDAQAGGWRAALVAIEAAKTIAGARAIAQAALAVGP